jgi:hypothetical protein
MKMRADPVSADASPASAIAPAPATTSRRVNRTVMSGRSVAFLRMSSSANR